MIEEAIGRDVTLGSPDRKEERDEEAEEVFKYLG